MNDMPLRNYEHKNVKLIDTDGYVYKGFVGDYIYADDSPYDVEGIVLDNLVRNDGTKYDNPIMFILPEIRSIEII